MMLQKQKRNLLLIWGTLRMTLTILPFYVRYVISYYTFKLIRKLLVSGGMNMGMFNLQLNVLELFLDCLTEPNERLVEFAIGGICNASAGSMPNCYVVRRT